MGDSPTSSQVSLVCAFHGKISEPPIYSNLTNIEDRISCALSCIKNNEHLLNENIQQKDQVKAKDYLNLGNVQLKRGLTHRAWRHYTTALACAEPNSEVLFCAYTNRSNVLYKWKYYDQCLADIKHALEIPCTRVRKAVLLIRRVKCLLGLRRKICPEVKTAIAKVEKCVAKMKERTRINFKVKFDDFIKKSATNLPPPARQMRSKTPVNIPTRNGKILQASNAIKLKYSPGKYGRHIVAARAIDVNDILLVERAFAGLGTSYDPSEDPIDLEFIYCGYCFKRAMASVPCKSCAFEVYCDEKCRDKAWIEYHDIECPVVSALSLNACPADGILLALRMTVKALKQAETIEALQVKLCKIDSVADPIAKFFVDGVFDSSKYSSTYALHQESAEISVPFSLALESARILVLLGKLTDIFGTKMSTLDDFINHKWTSFVGELILKNMLITLDFKGEQNIFYPDDDVQPRAHVIMPLVSLFNHSCDANACIESYDDVKVVYALEKIQKGQQIFVTYDGQNFTVNKSKEWRQGILKINYNFQCECRACKQNWVISDFPSFFDLPLVSRVAKAGVFTIMETTKRMMALSDGEDEYKTIKKNSLKAILNVMSSCIQTPCLEVQFLKNFLAFEYQMNSL